MRVLYCNKYNFEFSGTEVYLFELMDMMRDRGHEVALFSMADSRGRPTPYDHYFVTHVDFKKPEQGVFTRVKLAAHAIYSTEARRQLRRMISAFQPEIAHVRNIYHHLSPSILAELKAQGVPTLYHLNDFKMLCPTYNMVAHGQTCERCSGGRFRHVITEGCCTSPPGSAFVLAAEAYFHRWLGTYEKCVDGFLTPSRFAKEQLIRNGFDAGRITVLPHFQKLPAQPPSAVGPDAPIVYFGRLSPEKGVADLVHAMKHLPHLRLQIAGEGPQRQELGSLVDELGITNVEFTGHMAGENLDRLIGSARFTVLPSRAYETLGKTILESYAWGRPVVATDLGSRRELVHPGETGVLYEPGNVGQLVKAISSLAEQPDLAAKMGAAGRTLIAAQHAPEAHYQAIRQLYEDMGRRTAGGSMSLPVAPRPLPAPPVRVAFIGGRGVVSKYSGIETYYEEVGKRLVEKGYDVTIYCRRHFTPAMATSNGMRLVRLPTIRSKHLETFIHTLLSTIHAIASRHDIVHYHALGPALFSFVPRLFGQKTVVTVQGLDWRRKKWGRVASLVLRLGEKASARLPDRTMVVSRVLQERYRTRHGAEASYVPNGTTIRDHKPASWIQAWGLEPDGYILFLGRLSPEKNCHQLIAAYEMLHTRVKLVFAGGSSHTNSYAEELRKHESDSIVFLDWVSGDLLEELLSNAALFVLPSDMEGLSLALLDAMGAGVCALASDIPENREVLDGAGFTFRTGDIDDLSRKLRLLLSDQETRTATGRLARQRVRDHYLWPEIVSQIAQLYDHLTGRRPVAKQSGAGNFGAEAESKRVA